MQKDFMRKSGIATSYLAREMMTYKEGDRIPPISDYVDRYGVSRGTIQSSLNALCESAMTLAKCGHMGSYIQKINYSEIWSFTGWKTLLAAMPLPLNDSLRGLATALTMNMESSNIPFRLAFIQSAENRISTLLNSNVDFIVTSKLTADICTERNENLISSVELPEHTYTKSHVLVFHDPNVKEIQDGMKIAYDPCSYDQSYLIHLCCSGFQVELIPMPYRSTLRSLEMGLVDATVYLRETVMKSSYPFRIVPISTPEVGRKESTAVIITTKDNYWLSRLLQSAVDRQLIVMLQKQVMSGRLVPYY